MALYMKGKEFKDVQDSGRRQEFGTGAVRDTQTGKGRFDLLPAYALIRLAQHFENGARKYQDRNWEKGISLSRYLDSAMRHLVKYLGGSREEDHLAAVAWNVLCFIETENWVKEGILPRILNDLPVRKTQIEQYREGHPNDNSTADCDKGGLAAPKESYPGAIYHLRRMPKGWWNPSEG